MDLLRETWRNLRGHAVRYALTSIGIVWGTMMLTYLVSVTEGAQRHYIEQLQRVGQRVIWIFPGSLPKAKVGERGARRVVLENDDLARVERLASVQQADPSIAFWSAVVRAAPRTRLLTVFGVTAEADRVRNYGVATGRFLSQEDVENAARVAFLGAEAATRLFGSAPALGRTLQIESVRFRVIGVAERKGAQLVHVSGRDDEGVLVPYTTAQRWLHHTEKIEILMLEATSVASSWQAPNGVRQLLGLHHDYDPRIEAAMGFFNLQEAIGLVRTLFGGIEVFLLAASALTLLLGALGVTNIMLVVVRERRREIGLRKAIGATSRAIFVQFLVEAAAVALGAGLLGAFAGIALVHASSALVPPDAPSAAGALPSPLTALTIALALGGTAVAASIVPALRAARVPPAESLRDL